MNEITKQYIIAISPNCICNARRIAEDEISEDETLQKAVNAEHLRELFAKNYNINEPDYFKVFDIHEFVEMFNNADVEDDPNDIKELLKSYFIGTVTTRLPQLTIEDIIPFVRNPNYVVTLDGEQILSNLVFMLDGEITLTTRKALHHSGDVFNEDTVFDQNAVITPNTNRDAFFVRGRDNDHHQRCVEIRIFKKAIEVDKLCLKIEVDKLC